MRIPLFILSCLALSIARADPPCVLNDGSANSPRIHNPTLLNGANSGAFTLFMGSVPGVSLYSFENTLFAVRPNGGGANIQAGGLSLGCVGGFLSAGTNFAFQVNDNGDAKASTLTLPPTDSPPMIEVAGAKLFTLGTNLCVVIQSPSGEKSTNRITMTPYQ